MATAAVPGLDVVTAGAAAVADVAGMVATVTNVAQGAVSVINDVKDHKPLLETGLDLLNTIVAAKGLGGASSDVADHPGVRSAVADDASNAAKKGTTYNATFATRAEAKAAAYDRAGIEPGTTPDARWTVGGDMLRRGEPDYVYAPKGLRLARELRTVRDRERFSRYRGAHSGTRSTECPLPRGPAER